MFLMLCDVKTNAMMMMMMTITTTTAPVLHSFQRGNDTVHDMIRIGGGMFAVGGWGIGVMPFDDRLFQGDFRSLTRC